MEEGVDDGGRTPDGARPLWNIQGVDDGGHELVRHLSRAHRPRLYRAAPHPPLPLLMPAPSSHSSMTNVKDGTGSKQSSGSCPCFS